MRSGIWRIIGGVAVLLILAVITVRLLPAYVQNLRFQNALSVIVRQASESKSPDTMLLAQVLEQAARLGLPVHESDIRIRRAQGRIEIEVLYVVPERLPLYTVDLHFRPLARVP